jgi:hypothetical protein
MSPPATDTKTYTLAPLTPTNNLCTHHKQFVTVFWRKVEQAPHTIYCGKRHWLESGLASAEGYHEFRVDN